MNETIWIDKDGNTCIGIKPDIDVKPEKKQEEETENDTKKTTKRSGRKRP